MGIRGGRRNEQPRYDQLQERNAGRRDGYERGVGRTAADGGAGERGPGRGVRGKVLGTEKGEDLRRGRRGGGEGRDGSRNAVVVQLGGVAPTYDQDQAGRLVGCGALVKDEILRVGRKRECGERGR